MRVAVFGASGYTGLELLRILCRHPQVELAAVTSEQRAGQAVGDAFPSLRGLVDLRFESAADPTRIAAARRRRVHGAPARRLGAGRGRAAQGAAFR